MIDCRTRGRSLKVMTDRARRHRALLPSTRLVQAVEPGREKFDARRVRLHADCQPFRGSRRGKVPAGTTKSGPASASSCATLSKTRASGRGDRRSRTAHC